MIGRSGVRSQLPMAPGYSHPVFLGSGRFAQVWRLRQQKLDRHVVWKILETSDPNSSELEACQLAAHSSQRSPQIYNQGVWKGMPYIEMAWIRGCSLSDLLPVLPADQGLRILLARRFMEAVQEYQQQSGPHGDLNPGNFLCPPGERPFILDPGGEGFQSQGTPRYSAPERLADPQAVTLNSDAYSMAMILTEVVALPGIISSEQQEMLLQLQSIKDQESLRQQTYQNFYTWVMSFPISAQTEDQLDHFLQEQFSFWMGRQCAQSAELLIHKDPAQAMDLCQEALQWDPFQSEALQLLPRVQIGSTHSFRRYLLAVILPMALALACILYFKMQQEPDPEFTSHLSRTASPLLSPPEVQTPTEQKKDSEFRQPDDSHPKSMGLLVIAPFPLDCSLMDIASGRLLSPGRRSMNAGTYAVQYSCPGEPVRIKRFEIKPFAETYVNP